MPNIAKIPDRHSPRGMVAAEVRAELARAGISANRLASMTQVNQSYWSRRLTADIAFSIDDLAVLSSILDVPMSKFVPDFTPDGSTPGMPPRGGAARLATFLLPDLDSNQEPIGFTLQPSGVLAALDAKRAEKAAASRGDRKVARDLDGRGAA